MTHSGQWAGVILAAGKGTRMKSSIPKPLHRLRGLPILQHIVRNVRGAGVDRVIAVAAPEFASSPEFLDAAGEGTRVAVQPQQLGTGDALRAAESEATGAGSILVMPGDAPLIPAETLSAMRRRHEESGATITLLTVEVDEPGRLGRIVRGRNGAIRAIVEAKEADAETLAIKEVFSACYCLDGDWAWEALGRITPAQQSGELYLTDLVGIAAEQGLRVEAYGFDDPDEVSSVLFGVNDRVQLAETDAQLRRRINRHWMREGVTIVDPAKTYIDVDVRIGPDTVIQPNTHLLGHTVVGAECEIGPDSVLVDTEVGVGVKFLSSRAESAVVEDGADVGPFSHLRASARLAARVHVGNYAEVKNAYVGADSRIGHFSYVGDATVGKDVNIGAGTVVCNFDGERKHHTHIGDRVFVGSGSMLVAPVKLGDGSATGAGAVVTKDVPAGERVAGVPARAFGRTGAAAVGNGRQDGAADIQEKRTETEHGHARQ